MKKDSVFDELLVMKSQEGDNQAFSLLVKRWNKKLLSFTYRYVHDTDISKDIVQESWVAAYRGISKLHEPSKFSTWIYRLTYNKTIDHLRRQKKELDNNYHVKTNEESVEEGPWKTIERELKRLPTDQKIILTLFYLEQQSLKQISDILKLPEGTIKSRLFYAREKLKKRYKEEQHEKF